MYSLPKAGLLLLAAPLLFITNLSRAAPPASSSNNVHSRFWSCDQSPNIDSSLRVCTSVRGDVAYYRMDAVDGTRAELAIGSDQFELQQTGPDAVRISLGYPDNASFSAGATTSGISRRVYQDAFLVIDAVQNVSGPLTWIVYPLRRIASPLRAICTNAACSGGIQHP